MTDEEATKLLMWALYDYMSTRISVFKRIITESSNPYLVDYSRVGMNAISGEGRTSAITLMLKHLGVECE